MTIDVGIHFIDEQMYICDRLQRFQHDVRHAILTGDCDSYAVLTTVTVTIVNIEFALEISRILQCQLLAQLTDSTLRVGKEYLLR